MEQSSQPSPREWNEIHVVLADQTSPISEKHQGAIVDFVTALLMGKSPLHESWDLKDPDPSLLQEWHHHHLVNVEMFSRETFYIIQPHFAAPNEWWLFTTQSATAVLQCL